MLIRKVNLIASELRNDMVCLLTFQELRAGLAELNLIYGEKDFNPTAPGRRTGNLMKSFPQITRPFCSLFSTLSC